MVLRLKWEEITKFEYQARIGRGIVILRWIAGANEWRVTTAMQEILVSTSITNAVSETAKLEAERLLEQRLVEMLKELKGEQ